MPQRPQRNGLGIRVWGFGFRVEGLGFRVSGGSIRSSRPVWPEVVCFISQGNMGVSREKVLTMLKLDYVGGYIGSITLYIYIYSA